MRSGDTKRMARLGTGALLLLLVHGLCAPRSALAGCNHLVTSRIDQEQLSSRIGPLLLDLAEHSNPLPGPRGPTPLPERVVLGAAGYTAGSARGVWPRAARFLGLVHVDSRLGFGRFFLPFL